MTPAEQAAPRIVDVYLAPFSGFVPWTLVIVQDEEGRLWEATREGRTWSPWRPVPPLPSEPAPRSEG